MLSCRRASGGSTAGRAIIARLNRDTGTCHPPAPCAPSSERYRRAGAGVRSPGITIALPVRPVPPAGSHRRPRAPLRQGVLTRPRRRPARRPGGCTLPPAIPAGSTSGPPGPRPGGRSRGVQPGNYGLARRRAPRGSAAGEHLRPAGGVQTGRGVHRPLFGGRRRKLQRWSRWL